jgi:hypothetical protein
MMEGGKDIHVYKAEELQISGLLGEWKEIGTESRREMGRL